MGNFKRDNKKSGGNFNRDRGFGGGKKFSGRGGDKPTMHEAICNECGVSCEIPFKPTGDRPVFCSNCFKNQGSSGRSNKFGDKRRERSSFGNKEMYDVVCDKCAKKCQVPFKPTTSKPIFCDDCFRQDGNRSGSKNSGEIMKQINLLNSKIDKLMEILIPKTSEEKTKKIKIKKTTTVKKAVKEKKAKTKIKASAKKTSAKNKK